MSKIYQWAIVGAGPAGIATIGLLIDAGVASSEILWLDPQFRVGDFGRLWGEVSSNTCVELFKEFLTGIKSFDYVNRPESFALDTLPLSGFTYLNEVTKPLQWITKQLREKIASIQGRVTKLHASNGCWNMRVNDEVHCSQKIILATGAHAKTLDFPHSPTIDLSDALSIRKLATKANKGDTVAVFGSSHSAMIIIRNLLELGVERVINFYRSPLRFAVKFDTWTLYDNTGLKGETAKWVRTNLSCNLEPRIERYLSNKDNIESHLAKCNKVIYAVGFDQRAPHVENINPKDYDTSCGIIAPGLFGAGIGFPREVTDPIGNKEMNVGLWKFKNDINKALPIWMKYDL